MIRYLALAVACFTLSAYMALASSECLWGTGCSISAGSSPTWTGTHTFSGTVTMDELFINEQADAQADVAGDGQVWVNIATPNELYFTDDAGNDMRVQGLTTLFVATNITKAGDEGECFQVADPGATQSCGNLTLTGVPYAGTAFIKRIDCFVGIVSGENAGDDITLVVDSRDETGSDSDQTSGFTYDLSPTLSTGEYQGSAINETLTPTSGGSWYLKISAMTDADASITDADFNCTVEWYQMP